MTLSELQEHLKSANKVGLITLSNGVELSVQASENHYCSPRDNDGPWISVEVGISHKDFYELRFILRDLDILQKFEMSGLDFWVASWLPINKVIDITGHSYLTEED
jgi:hypothetical protein